MTDNPRIRFVVLFLLAAVGVEGAAEVPHQKGRFQVVFNRYSPYSDTSSIADRMRILVGPGTFNGHPYAIRNETFEAYVPQAYDPNTPFGLLVWISPSPDGGIDGYQGFRELMDKHKLIWVGANRSGNEEDVYRRRIPLALDAAFNMTKLYRIDPKRIYVAGLSGGGRAASHTAFCHSDVFSGGLFIIGADFWKPASVPEQKVRWKATSPKPKPQYLARAKEYGRYVLLTGDNDMNRLQMQTYYKGYSRELDCVLYIQVPGMGHQTPPPKAMEQALDYLDMPVTKTN